MIKTAAKVGILVELSIQWSCLKQDWV